MKTIRISETLALPLDGASGSPGAVTQKYSFLGRTGSGKTYAATKLAELMLDARAQVVALDPVGVWPFLRIGPEPFSLPVLGGLYGDVPLESTGGALVADFVADTGSSAVLDVSQFTSAEQSRFATAFATRFFQKKKAAPSAVHLFLEECQEFVPQNASAGDAHMLHAFERLVKLGRNFGIGVSLISQRPQEVNKKALNQTECLFAFQMTGPQERKAIAGWAADKGLDVDLVEALPKLAVGHAHVWSPQWLGVSKEVLISKKRTADGSATPTAGTVLSGWQLSPVDLPALRNAMTETVEREKANDPKALRARIAELERKLVAANSAITIPKVEVERVEVPVVDEAAFRELLELVTGYADSVVGAASEAKNSIGKALNVYRQQVESRAPKRAPNAVEVRAAPYIRSPRAHPQAAAVPRANGAVASADVGKGGLRRILIALAQRPGLTNRQLGVRACLSSKSGTFANYLSKARQSGWIRDDGDRRYIEQKGFDALGGYEPLPEGRALLQHWLGELGTSGAARMLDALARAYPLWMTNTELGKAAGISHASGTFANYLSRLRTLELIEGGRGQLRMSEELAG